MEIIKIIIMCLFYLSCLNIVGLSVYNTLSLKIKIIKDIANLGYRVDLNRFDELQYKFTKENYNKDLFSRVIYTLCSIVSLASASRRLTTYYRTRKQVLKKLDKLDAVYLMDEIELEEYNKKRTGFNALKTWVKTDKLKSNPVIVEDKLNKISYYTLNDKIVILDASGDVAKLSKDEQLNFILMSHLKTFESMLDEIKVNANQEVNENDKEIIKKSDRKQLLKDLKKTKEALLEKQKIEEPNVKKLK